MDEKITNLGKNKDVDFGELLNKYMKHWYYFVISMILCVGIAYLYLKVTKPVYQISSSILIKPDKGGNLESAMLKGFSLGNMMLGGSKSVDDEALVLSSHSMIRSAGKLLDLNKQYIVSKTLGTKDCYLDYPIEVYPPAGLADTLSKVILFDIKVDKRGKIKVSVKDSKEKLVQMEADGFPFSVNTKYGLFTVNATPYYERGKKLRMKFILKGYDLTAEELKKRLNIGIVSKKANLIYLEVADNNIQRGKDLLNMLLTEYNKTGIQIKNQEAENTAKFINERINLVYSDLHESEERVESYKRKNNLTDIETEAKILLEQNGDFKKRLVETETEYSVVQLIVNFLSDPENQYALVPFSVGLSDKASTDAIQQYNELLLERMKLLNATSENNPTLKLLNEQISAMRGNVVSTVLNMKESVGIALSDLRTQEEIFLSRIKGMPTQEREFVDLKRQQLIKEELYVFLLKKKEENALALAITTPKGIVIDEAYNLNKPIKPKKMTVALIALIMGVMLPIIYFYLRDLLKMKFSTKQELEKITSAPVLGEICMDRNHEKIVVKEGESSSIAELFRLLRTNIQFVLTKSTDKVILVTSSVSGEGKSFISTNFAHSLALMNKKVILIGLDIRSPKLAEYLNLSHPKGGITTYLANDQYSYRDIIIKSPIQKNLDIILAGPVPPNPAELLLSKRLDELFAVLREEYDYIIVDSAPVGMVADTFSLTRVADATLYVCRANYTQKDNIRYADRLIAEGRLKNVSLVINGTMTKQGYGYGYGEKHKPKKHN